jgi:hypothetical protein
VDKMKKQMPCYLGVEHRRRLRAIAAMCADELNTRNAILEFAIDYTFEGMRCQEKSVLQNTAVAQ